LLAGLALSPGRAAACQQFPIVYFRGGSTIINPDGQAGLRGFAQQALERLNGIRSIRIVGHSDRTGSRAARQRISLLRAQAVRDVLIASGVPARLLAASGAGDSQPSIETADRTREPMNRRVELEVAYSPDAAASRAASPCEPS
jgi:outer membrane protein OmpA-like peptidoglycan-associated protein